MAKLSENDLAKMRYNSSVYFENNFRMEESISKLENILIKK